MHVHLVTPVWGRAPLYSGKVFGMMGVPMLLGGRATDSSAALLFHSRPHTTREKREGSHTIQRNLATDVLDLDT
jgi:hypothetical protein